MVEDSNPPPWSTKLYQKGVPERVKMYVLKSLLQMLPLFAEEKESEKCGNTCEAKQYRNIQHYR